MFAIVFLILSIFVWRSPRPFPEHALVTISRGESLGEIAQSFKQRGVVRSAFWLQALTTLMGGEKSVVAGDYYFPEATSILGVAIMLQRGEFGLIPLRVTIPEGVSSYEIAETLDLELPNFDREEFLDQVADGNFEGYLFPDTYFFMPNANADDVILTMRENFARNIQPYEQDIASSTRDFRDIVVMASIIEGEGRMLESKRIISGILWKRIQKKMPLQVDAPFKYYSGKNSYTLTTEDLKEDHAYNTYVNKGLPPSAINNPGIDSIRAAIAPTASEYFYFLSDKSGGMHYAKDFAGHKQNRELYLNS